MQGKAKDNEGRLPLKIFSKMDQQYSGRKHNSGRIPEKLYLVCFLQNVMQKELIQ